MAQKAGDDAYRAELFERLKKSIGYKEEQESFRSSLKPASWWLLEDPHPKSVDVMDLIHTNCPFLKGQRSSKKRECGRSLIDVIERAYKEKAPVKFDCINGLHGFVYPISQGDTVYGYIGICYAKKEIPAPILNIFSAFTDTLVREVQKELELSKLYETIRPRAIALSTVHTVHRLISSTLDLNELLPRIARLSLQIMRANRCSIKLIDSRKKVLLPKVTIDLRAKKAMLKKVRVGRWAPGKAVKYGRPVRGDNYLATPLIDEDVIGVITVYDKTDRRPFTQFDQEIMSTMAEQAVIAIKNAQLYRDQEKLTMGSIKSLATILDARAKGTYVVRPSFLRISALMGQKLHMKSEELKSLEYALLLHDAGQIIVPDQVLSKPTKLTGKEYEMVKEHPVMGAEIIKHMRALKAVIPMILYHHEKFDGTGYPKGLKRYEIPLGARIMAVASAFEAMVTKRPYRVPKTIGEAVEEIRQNAGSQFDPKVVEVFLKVVARKDIRSILSKETPLSAA